MDPGLEFGAVEAYSGGVIPVMPASELWAGAEAAAGVGAEACGGNQAYAGAAKVPWCAGQLVGVHQDDAGGDEGAVLVTGRRHR